MLPRTWRFYMNATLSIERNIGEENRERESEGRWKTRENERSCS